MTKAIGIALAALALAACSQEVPNLPATPAATTATTANTPAAGAPGIDSPRLDPPSPDRIPADAFTVTLSDVDCSEAAVAVATVRWDAGTLAAGGVSVFIESPQNPRKLWADAAKKDEATTGKWVFEGSRFTLQDRESGAVLAQRTVDKIPCPSP